MVCKDFLSTLLVFSGACGPWLQFKVPLLICFGSRSRPRGRLVLFELRVMSERLLILFMLWFVVVAVSLKVSITKGQNFS